MTSIELASATDWAGFSHATRALVQAGVAPDALRWTVAGEAGACGDLFDDGAAQPADGLPTAAPLPLPARFVEPARLAALHADPSRFDLLYRLVWRLHRQRTLAQDRLDTDWRALETLAQAVRREMHRMKAFVRFRPLRDGQALRHLAWFEPGHHVVAAVAPFFVRRFANMDWAILTPQVSVCWNQQALAFGPGLRREQVPDIDDADEAAGQALWLAYYASTFNPARVNLAGMTRHMPVRYWHNLPEAALIAPLAAQAAQRTGRMLAAEPATPRRRPRALRATGPGRPD